MQQRTKRGRSPLPPSIKARRSPREEGSTESRVKDLIERGIRLHQAGQIAQAIHCYERALELAQNSAEVLQLLGAAEAQIGKLASALVHFQRSITLSPGIASYHNNHANVLRELSRFQEALEGYDKSILINPDSPAAWNNRGVVLHELGRTEEALASFSEALALQPHNPDALNNRSRSLAALGRHKEALEHCRQALVLRPNFKEAIFNCGNLLKLQGQFHEALAMFNRILDSHPDHLDALNEVGNICRELKKHHRALDIYDKILTLDPRFVSALNNQGNTFRELKQFDDALRSYARALNIEPERAEVHFNQAVTLEELGRYREALQHYLEASRLQPEVVRYWGAIQHVRMFLCDWSNFDEALDRIQEALRDARAAVDPFAALALFDAPDLHRIAAELFIRERFRKSGDDARSRPMAICLSENRKPRIGYFSSDFHNHATMHLFLDVLRNHDRESFEYYAFSFGPDSDDEWQQEARSCFTDFLDVRNLSDADVCELARRIGLDIAVDLKGFTHGARMGVFAEGAAPLQVSFLGYPGTTGSPFMDYAIVDKEVVPLGADIHFSESLIYFPGCYQPNMSMRQTTQESLSRFELGLPENGVVYCSFNSIHKLTPAIFRAWMAILRAVDSGCLWLLGTNEVAKENLWRCAETEGVRASRIIFAGYLPIEQHLNRIRFGDIFLDMFPYGAHTTASDALRAGIPLITLRGASFASRVASSLLKELGLVELVTDNLADYTKLAIHLGSDPRELFECRQRVARASVAGRLFDAVRYSKELEAIYRGLIAQYAAAHGG